MSYNSLTNLTAIWAQPQSFKSFDPNAYPLHELQNLEVDLLLPNQIQEHIIVTEDEDLKEGCDGHVSITSQRPERSL